MTTVAVYLDFTQGQLDTFEELAETSEYWASALEFYNQKKDTDVGKLSPKQMNWLNKIYDDVFEEARK